MNKRSTVLMAAGLVGSLVMGVVAFALGALGPVASAAGPHIGVHHKAQPHEMLKAPEHVHASAVGSTNTNTVAVEPADAPSALNTQPNSSGGDGQEPQAGDDPELTTSPSPEPSESPSAPPTGGSGSDDPTTSPAPSPQPTPTPSPSPGSGDDDGSGDD